jgi:hypothetical protein
MADGVICILGCSLFIKLIPEGIFICIPKSQ